MKKELPDAILNGRLKQDGETGDRKRCFVVSTTNNGYEDLRMEIDTDDCDKAFAKKWRDRIIACVNACQGVADPSTLKRP